MKKEIILSIIPIVLCGCMDKLKITPQPLQADSAKQLLALETFNSSDIGTVYKRCLDVEDGKKIDTGWISTPEHIFPPNIDDYNKTIESPSSGGMDTRKAIYITEITSSGGFIPFFSSKGSVSKAYRYFAKIDKAILFDTTTFRYNTDTVNEINERDPDRKCQYSYIKALHIGNVTIESMDKVNVSTQLQVQAAFSINGDFYKTSEELTNKTGVVLYELAPFEVPQNLAQSGININTLSVNPLAPFQMLRVRKIYKNIAE